MTLRLSRLFSLLFLGAVLLSVAPLQAASWKTGSYGGNLTMTYYVPDNVAPNPALVLSLHYCSGNEGNGQGWFKSFADQYGFVIISPKSPGNCWDAAPGRSGDRAQLAMMIDWAIETLSVDPTRVYSAGASSGACMSETMLASYPDKIAAASVLAGVPVGFWMTGNECNVCSQQVATGSAASWGDRVRSAGPSGYTGSRGRIQLWHAAQDQYLGSGNLEVEVGQWGNVLGVMGDGTEEANSPRSGWTRTSYEDGTGTIVVQSNWWGSSPPNSHDLTSNINPALWDEVVKFFGLDQAAAPVSSASAAPSVSAVASASAAATAVPSAAMSSAGPLPSEAPAASSTPPTMSAAPSTTSGGAATTAAMPSTVPSVPGPATTSSAGGASTVASAAPPAPSTSSAPAPSVSVDDNVERLAPGCSCQVIGANASSSGGLALLFAAGIGAAVGSRRRTRR